MSKLPQWILYEDNTRYVFDNGMTLAKTDLLPDSYPTGSSCSFDPAREKDYLTAFREKYFRAKNSESIGGWSGPNRSTVVAYMNHEGEITDFYTAPKKRVGNFPIELQVLSEGELMSREYIELIRVPHDDQKTFCQWADPFCATVYRINMKKYKSEREPQNSGLLMRFFRRLFPY